MTKFRKLDERLIVGAPGQARSGLWRLNSTNNCVYLTSAGVAPQKFSFHKSGICRNAFLDTFPLPPGMNDRVMFKWRRNFAPAAGEGKAIKVLDVIIPTDYLSTALDPETKSVNWISPAPAGKSTVLQMLFTREDHATVTALVEENNQSVAAYAPLPNGESFAVLSGVSDFAGDDVSVPAGPAQTHSFVFHRDDPLAAGRPARIQFYNSPKDGDACKAWEYGGIRRKGSPPATGATLTRDNVLHTTWKD